MWLAKITTPKTKEEDRIIASLDRQIKRSREEAETIGELTDPHHISSGSLELRQMGARGEPGIIHTVRTAQSYDIQGMNFTAQESRRAELARQQFQQIDNHFIDEYVQRTAAERASVDEHSGQRLNQEVLDSIARSQRLRLATLNRMQRAHEYNISDNLDQAISQRTQRMRQELFVAELEKVPSVKQTPVEQRKEIDMNDRCLDDLT